MTMFNKGSVAMMLFTEGDYTIDDIYALPEGERAELIEGQIFDMSSPGYKHQKLTFSLARTIADYIDANGGSCEVLPAPFAVIIKKDKKNYVEPDISVICDKDKLSDRGCEGAPDFVIEVVSPSSRKMDYVTKNALYADAGVREYWIVDPDKESTTIYYYEKDVSPLIVPFDQDIPGGIYKDLQINISELLK